jgi:hypothetical protein
MVAMDNYLITADGAGHEASPHGPDGLRRLIGSSTRFWLDLDGLDQHDSDALLRDTFGFHPLALRAAERFGQRPKLDTCDGFVLLVMYGVSRTGRLAEVHCFYTGTYWSPSTMTRARICAAWPSGSGRVRCRSPILSCCCTRSPTSWWTATSRCWAGWMARSTNWRTRSCSGRPTSSSGSCLT